MVEQLEREEEFSTSRRGVPTIIYGGFSYPSFPLSSFFCSYIHTQLGVEEPGLTHETAASILTKVKVLLLEEKFILVAGIHLGAPGKNEQITKGTVTKVTLHEEF